jgi:hypothetical protein
MGLVARKMKRMFIPEHVKRTEVEAVVPDSMTKEVVDGRNIKQSQSWEDISDAYETGTKTSEEVILALE